MKHDLVLSVWKLCLLRYLWILQTNKKRWFLTNGLVFVACPRPRQNGCGNEWHFKYMKKSKSKISSHFTNHTRPVISVKEAEKNVVWGLKIDNPYLSSVNETQKYLPLPPWRIFFIKLNGHATQVFFFIPKKQIKNNCQNRFPRLYFFGKVKTKPSFFVTIFFFFFRFKINVQRRAPVTSSLFCMAGNGVTLGLGPLGVSLTT